ncbi:uncharacterized protein J3D65DRAFT_620632 [Phyllosticta citribraziliensis]|uniref:Transmembrane protein n=1 Tax=Phyllosticta citribraziliensis TaxID=989973 RepID=A0ABR1LXZ3_9PEZI
MTLVVQQVAHTAWRLALGALSSLDGYVPSTSLGLVGLLLVPLVAGVLFVFCLCFGRLATATHLSIHMAQNQHHEQASLRQHQDPAQPRRRSSTALQLIDEAIRAVQQRNFWRKVVVFVGAAFTLALALAAHHWWSVAHANANSNANSSLFHVSSLMDSATKGSSESDAVYRASPDVDILVHHIKALAPTYNGGQLRRLMFEDTGDDGVCWSDLLAVNVRETNVKAGILRKEVGSMLNQMSWWRWRDVIKRVSVMGESILAFSCSEAVAAAQPWRCVANARYLFVQARNEVGGLEDIARRTLGAASNLSSRMNKLANATDSVHECYKGRMLDAKDGVEKLAKLPLYLKVARCILPNIETSYPAMVLRQSTKRFELEDEHGRAVIERLVKARLGARRQLPAQVLQHFIQTLEEYLAFTARSMAELDGLLEDMVVERHMELGWEERRKMVFTSMRTMVTIMAPLAIKGSTVNVDQN